MQLTFVAQPVNVIAELPNGTKYQKQMAVNAADAWCQQNDSILRIVERELGAGCIVKWTYC